MSHNWTLLSDSPVLGQWWVWLPVWLCATVRRPQLCLSVGPSGKKAHPGSGATQMAHHTPGSCQHPEPTITHTMLGVLVTPPVYFTLEKTDISAVSLLSDACRQCKMNGETVVLCASEPSILCDSCNSKHQCLFLLDRATDNERNLLAV